MHRAIINLTPLIDLLFIILFVILGQSSEEVKTHIDREREERRQLSREKQDLSRSKSALQMRYFRTEEERIELTEKFDREQRAALELERRLQKTQAELQQEREKNAELKNRYGDLAKRHEEDKNLFQKSIDELKKQKEVLFSRLQEEMAKLQQTQKEKDDLEKNLADVTEEKVQLAEEIKGLQSAISECQSKWKAEKEKVVELQSKLTDLYLEEELQKQHYEKLQKQYQEMENNLEGRELYRTMLKSQIVADNFQLYEITLISESGSSKDKYTTQMEIRKLDGKKWAEILRGEEVQEKVRKLFQQAIPPAMMINASSNIFLVFQEGTAILEHRRLVEDELKKLKVIYGIFDIP